MNVELSNLHRDILKKNGGFAIILFIFFAIIAALVSLASYFFFGLVIIIAPIIILPLYFAFSSMVLLYREGGQVTFTNFFKAFGAFFSPRFRGTYHYIRTILFTFLISILGLILMSLIITPIFYHTNFHGFADFVSEAMADVTSSTALNELMSKYSEALSNYQFTTTLPSMIIACLFMYYHLMGNSFAYFLYNSATLDASTLRFIYLEFVKKYRWKLFKNRFIHLWFVYVLFLAAFLGAAYLAYYLNLDVNSILAIGLGGAILLPTVVFGSYSFAFEEAHFLRYRKELIEYGEQCILKIVGRNFDLNDEEKTSFTKEYLTKMGVRVDDSEDKKNDA